MTFNDLVRLHDLPSCEDMLDVVVAGPSHAGSTVIDENSFLKLWRSMTPLSPDDPVLSNWHYAPWRTVKFNTRQGTFEVRLFLGGLAFVTLPDGRTGAATFSHP